MMQSAKHGSVDDILAEDSISISNQKPRCRIKGKRLEQLQARPVGVRVGRDVEVNDLSPIEGQNQEDV